MKFRRILARLIAAAMVAGLSSAAAASRFADVQAGSWYSEAVEAFAENGLINGVSETRFDPNGTMTRAMVVTILSRMGGGVMPTEPARFSDVPADAWYSKAVAWAQENRIADGVGNGRFAPGEPVTREQLVTFLWRYAYLRYEPDFDRFYAEEAFTDADPVSSWAQDAVRLSIGAGVLQGRGDGWHAKALCTRAEAVTMLYRFVRLGLADREPEAFDDLTPAQLDLLADRSLRLFCAMDKPGENPVASPLSALYALAMLYNGATGETAAQLNAFFGMNPTDTSLAFAALTSTLTDVHGKTVVRPANAVWLKLGEPINPSFAEVNRDVLGAEIFCRSLDGETVREINAWVSEQTDGMIPSILNELSPDALVVLLNALLFKAQWEEPFREQEPRDFHAANGSTETAQMLLSTETIYLHDADAEGFLKPFSDGRYAFAVLIPREGLAPEDYLSGLDGASLRTLLVGERYDAVHAGMPAFSAELESDLMKAFPGVGLTDLNCLGGIMPEAYVSSAVHKARIEVDENGVSAAAATAIVIAKGVVPHQDQKEVTVIADRPYVYMIVDTQTNLPLFIGTVESVA